MEITREVVIQRLADLRDKREEMIANVNAFNGAIQMTEEWLAFLDYTEPEQPVLTVVPDQE